jgi:hypothetical protein
MQERHRRDGKPGEANEPQGATMSLTATIVLIGILDLGVVLAVAAIMGVPFTLDRREKKAAIHAIAAPLPNDLAA